MMSQISVSATGLARTSEGDEQTLFEYFPKLPIEIRHNIWKTFCCIPRNVAIDVESVWGKAAAGYTALGKIRCAVFNSINGIPAILDVSKEAREEGLKYYTLEFGAKTSGNISRGKIQVRIEPRIYVNFDVDTLFLLDFDDYQRSYSPGFEFIDRLEELVESREQLLDSVAIPFDFVQRCLKGNGMPMDDVEEHSPKWMNVLNRLIRGELLIYSVVGGRFGPKNIRFTPFKPDAVVTEAVVLEPWRAPEDLALETAKCLLQTRDMELRRREEEEKMRSKRHQTPCQFPDLKIVHMEFDPR